MLFTHAFHLTSTVDGRACQIIGEATNRVCAGELRQVTERGNLELSEADYFAIIDGKTAALTECCGRLGALYAGASEEVAAKLAGYGRNLGLAFQIADDLLDLVGTEDAAGKTLGTDLEQQKLTLPVIHCLHRLAPAEAAKLRDAIRTGADGLGLRVLHALEKTQSMAYAKRRAEELRPRRPAGTGVPAAERVPHDPGSRRRVERAKREVVGRAGSVSDRSRASGSLGGCNANRSPRSDVSDSGCDWLGRRDWNPDWRIVVRVRSSIRACVGRLVRSSRRGNYRSRSALHSGDAPLCTHWIGVRCRRRGVFRDCGCRGLQGCRRLVGGASAVRRCFHARWLGFNHRFGPLRIVKMGRQKGSAKCPRCG